ncbi:hypothetical protein ACFQMA_02000 [Halosimplex aquaticum]|uniref:Peptidase n=1 Tax=Halosimplex aquaticum TaxID=3026162 RepID=A0ABD5XU39_9EURY|nr:hypothetical protein [Halosimplex aquaticum]
MALRTSVATVLAVALVALAGCSGPLAGDAATPTEPSSSTATETSTATRTSADATTSTPTATDTPTATRTPVQSPTDGAGSGVGESERVVVNNGTLSVNATTVYRRVERLLGADAPAPTVEVTERPAVNLSGGSVRSERRALGFRAGPGSIGECGDIYPANAGADEVRVTVGDRSPREVELVLVHEFVHVLQYNDSDYDELSNQTDYTLGHALGEGAAVYAAQTYGERYGASYDGKTPVELRRCLYERVGDADREWIGQYYFGARYYQQRVDSPADFSTVYRSPPRTTEQLIHGLEPGAEPPATLSVAVESSGDWRAERREQKGELALRTWLRVGLDGERVDTAASGWGNDTFVRFERNGTDSVAWAIRTDSAADANELEAAVTDLATVLRDRNATTVRQVRASDRTLVVFAGQKTFVSNATASGTDGDVTLTVP